MPSLKIPNCSILAATLAFSGLVLICSSVSGQESSPYVTSSCPKPTIGPVLPPVPDRSFSPIIIYAQQLDADKHEEANIRGNVELYRADQHLATEQILYDPEIKKVTLPVKVAYEDQQIWVRGKEAFYSFEDESGIFTLIDYGLTGSSAHGSAESAEMIGGHTSQLQDLVYTTCPGEQPDWELSASNLELQHDKGQGYARGAKLKFKGVPIFYAPWFTFPIDDRRKSGFLYPSFAKTNDNGFEFGIPYYWNIAPNQDATIEPSYLTNRGFRLSAKYRFLTRKTGGFLDFSYIPDDKETGDGRYHYLLQHHAAPWRRWNTELVVERVGDDEYFQDFGRSLRQTSIQFLRSSALLNGVGRYWNFEIMADDFQVIDDSIRPQNKPYRRVPRLAYWMDMPIKRSDFSFGLNSELVYFDRDIGATGARFDLYPEFYWHRFNHWGFIKPSLGYRYTAYNLDNVLLPLDDSPDRGTVIASLDGGLYFDRQTKGGHSQTLEPRLFYLYVPYENQDDLPIFDTGEFTFGFSQLFNTNRFAGADRQSDANQLSVALTSRTFDGADGQELWRLSLGQIFYFESQRVQLNERPETDKNLSPFITELAWQPLNRLSTIAGLQYDWNDNRIDVGSLGLRWSGKNGQRIGFEYRFRRDRVDQFDFRVFWPVNERWRVLSRINYSFADSDMLEFQGGVEYESCCWAVRTVFRRYLKNRDGDYRDGIFFELNLKGLASAGTRTRELFPN